MKVLQVDASPSYSVNAWLMNGVSKEMSCEWHGGIISHKYRWKSLHVCHVHERLAGLKCKCPAILTRSCVYIFAFYVAFLFSFAKEFEFNMFRPGSFSTVVG